ncbi:MAG: electron transporter RnfD, partial [Clostridiales bacterium]|nr:electron transporter RnfD [Clostridiales bacterium]
GKESKIFFEHKDEEINLKLASDLDPNENHSLILFKRQDATHYFEFLGFEIQGEAKILPPPIRPSRRIEVYGDSVSAGAVCEAAQFAGKCDPENHEGIYDNSWHSYSMTVARNLGAEIHNIAQGGIALFNGSGYYHAPNHIGVESAYDKLCYFPEGNISNWDFSKYVPQVVIFAFGQNDNHHEGFEDFDISNPEYRQKWKARYKEVLLDIRNHYDNPVFILMTTLLCHDAEWDNAIEEIKNELIADGLVPKEKLYHHLFKRNGIATPGHPRICEQQEMAEELTAFISSLGESIWQ